MSNITASQFIAEARKWLGYYGKSAGEDLGTFEAEKVGKYTIFAEYFDDLKRQTGGPLNLLKNPCEWCSLFPLYLACNLCGNVDDGFALFYQWYWDKSLHDCASSAPSMGGIFKYWGHTFAEPKAGDLGFMYNDDHSDIQHVVIVQRVNDDGTILTIEGNWGNCVCEITRPIADFIYFGRPDYAEETVEEPEPEESEQEPEQTEQDTRDQQIAELQKEKQSLMTSLANYSKKLSEATEAKGIAELRAEKAETELADIKAKIKGFKELFKDE